MTYHLAPPRNRAVAIVGCGGTGGFAAEGLARLGVPLLLIDGDRVEERNLSRQNFYPEDLGKFKAEALAYRLARKYGNAMGYSNTPLLEYSREEVPSSIPGFTHIPMSFLDDYTVVGCVDNGMARAAIASHISHQWWVDAGNGPTFGQVLVGNNPRGVGGSGFFPDLQLIEELPPPNHVFPELVGQDITWVPMHACAQAVEAGQQGPTINTWMATLVVETVWRLLEGRLTYWQLYLDLEHMTVRMVEPTPEGVTKFLGGPTATVKATL